ncbi:TPA: hypothetical protein ACGTIT_004941, partial [Escherichia coli]
LKRWHRRKMLDVLGMSARTVMSYERVCRLYEESSPF